MLVKGVPGGFFVSGRLAMTQPKMSADALKVHLCFPGGWFNKKMLSYQYRKSHCGDKTILRPSYLHNGISYTGKMTSLYWIRVLVSPGYFVSCHLPVLIGRSPGPWTTMVGCTSRRHYLATQPQCLMKRTHQEETTWELSLNYWDHFLFQIVSSKVLDNERCYYVTSSLIG